MFLIEELQTILQNLGDQPKFLIAFSGGLDSTVLLHALVKLRSQWSELQLRALHIHHGLYSQADQWEQYCQQFCSQFNVPYLSERVVLPLKPGDSIEAVAREARYQVFKKLLVPGENLLTAHHQDDQAETLLLQLLRGAGVSGLAAMPAKRRFEKCWHLRPLLKFPRADLQAYAQQHQLTWMNDPGNEDLRFDRNFIRHKILPLLQQRFPGVTENLSRTARHCADAKVLLKELALQDLSKILCIQDHTLNIALLKKLSRSRQINVLRYWWQQFNIPMPTTKQITTILRDFLQSRYDANPYFSWQGYELRRFQNKLFVMSKLIEFSPDWSEHWHLVDALKTPVGELTAVQTVGEGIAIAKIAAPLTVKFRHGGEKINLPGRGRHSLKHCWQEWNVPSWQRQRIPLLFQGDKLIAVVGFCVCADYQAEANQPGWVIKFIED